MPGVYALPIVALVFSAVVMVLRSQTEILKSLGSGIFLVSAAFVLSAYSSRWGTLVILALAVASTIFYVRKRFPSGIRANKEFLFLLAFGGTCYAAFVVADLVRPSVVPLAPLGAVLFQICFFTALVVLDQRLQISRLESFSMRASQVAHDIRSPCTALQIAAGKLGENGHNTWSDIILRSSERINAIAADLVSVAVGDLTSASGEDVCDLEHELRALILVKQIEFKSQAHLAIFSSGHVRLADLSSVQRMELMRVLCNLMNNAFEARSLLGESEIRLELKVEQNRLICSVADNGCGILPMHSARIARQERFSSKKVGLGLGLVSARRLAHNWGGAFSLRTEDDGWTRATLRIPVHMSSRGLVLRAQAEPPHRSNVDVVSIQ